MNLDKIAPALVALQAALTPVGKSADNPFFKSRYAPLPEVREALKPHLAANGLALLTFPSIIHAQDGLLHNGLHFYLIHESGQYLEGEWLLTPAKRDPQGEGSDVTYKLRYATQAITGLVADDDDDGNRASVVDDAAGKQPRRPAKSGNTQLEAAKARLRDAIKSSGVDAKAYAWVAKATEDDISKIEGLADALADAPAPPKPKTPADVARDKLAALVRRHKLDGRKIGQRFTDDYGVSIYEADEAAIEGFTQVIADEVAVDEAAE